MQREATWGAAIVIAMAAAVGISTQSTKTSGDSSGRGQLAHKGGELPRVGAKNQTGRACSDAEKMLQEFLLTQENSVAAPLSCYDPGNAPSRRDALALTTKASQLKFVIATLPDPLHTHFSLLFDRDAEAIQQAAQDEGYEYDSSWLPWETEERSFNYLADQDTIDDRKDAREDQPGIIVFRKKNDPTSKQPSQQPFQEGLIVFVVGEEATRGIHRRQFENAAAWINSLRPGFSSPIAILGPTFSGSFPSLAELLADDVVHQSLNYKAAEHWSPNQQVRIYSGSVTGQTAAEWFGTISSNDAQLKSWRVSFHSFLESDDSVFQKYCKHLTDSKLEAGRVAVISEDETAYGSNGLQDTTGSLEPCSGAVHLYYPRDISALRAAYQTQSIFSSSPSQQSADTQRRNLPSDLADPAGEAHDTIRAYGGNQTPLSQEAQLLGIVSALRTHRSQYLFIRSSNMLDPLFLANFFRRAYPEGRVVIRGSDLLFERERGSTGINGVMTLSSYPLFPWKWTDWPSNGASHRVFGEDLVEGAYIATRFLLHDPRAPGENLRKLPKCSSQSEMLSQDLFLPSNLLSECFAIPIPDYAAPFWAVPEKCEAKGAVVDASCTPHLRPAMWLSVLGRGTFYPLAALNRNDSSKNNAPPDPHISQGRTGVPLSMKVCLLFILVFAGIHTACCWKASFTAKPAFRAHFASTYNWRFPGCWRHPVLISLGGTLIAFIALVAGWGCGAFSDVGEPLPSSCLVRSFLVLAWLIVLGSIVANNLAVKKLAEHKIRERSRPQSASLRRWAASLSVWSRKRLGGSLLLFLLAITGFCLAFVAPLELALNIENRVPTYWRSMNLTSGVSPVVPFLTLFTGLYAWFWFSLHGLALFGPDRPRLPLLSSLRVKNRNGKEIKDKHRKGVDLLRMFSQEEADRTEQAAIPLEGRTLCLAGILFAFFAVVAYALAPRVPLRSLGASEYAIIFCLWLDLCFSLLLAEAWQLWRTWGRLKQLLAFLDRIAIRRTMGALRGFSWGSVWKMSGNVLEVRYKLVSRQIESLNHLREALDNLATDSHDPDSDDDAVAAQHCLSDVTAAQVATLSFAEWYSKSYCDADAGNFKTLETYQKRVAALSGKLLTDVLIPAWRRDTDSLLLIEARADSDQPGTPDKVPLASIKKHIRNAEELVCLPYLGFVQNILGRMRTLVLGMAWLFVAVTLAVSSYPFDPRPGLSGTLICLFLALGVIISLVYANMHRDSTLSHLTNTTPGELGPEFWFKLIGFGLGPLLGLLTTVFPGLADFLFSWLEPGLASLK